MQKATELISSIKGQFVAIAVSGGMDSMCLLHICLEILGKENLLVLSVNHNLRGAESDGDYDFVQEYCKRNGCEFLGASVDVKKISVERGIGIELAARLARREFFQSVRARVTRVLLAHHQSDQAETVLLHMLRGCGQDGLSGMDVLTDDYYFRPLLFTAKEEIERYVREKSVPFLTDSSNSSSDYDRNFLRNEVIPLLEQRWSGVQRSITRLAAIMSTYRTEINESCITIDGNSARLNFHTLVARTPSTHSQINSSQLDTDKPHTAHSVTAPSSQLKPHRAAAPSSQLIDHIRHCLSQLDALVDISYDNLVTIARLASSPSGKRFINKGLTVTREFDSLLFQKNDSAPCGADCHCVGVATRAEGTIISVSREDYAERRYPLIFDYDKLPHGFVVRYRQEGDFFTPFGGKAKKLKKYLIDKKIPQSVRDHLPLVACGSEVYVIMGIEISDKVRIDNNTTKLSILGRAD